MPLTRAITGLDVEPPDEDDDDDCCCPHPVTIGSTSSARAATVENAVRRRGSSARVDCDGRGSLSEIMALSLKMILGPADRGTRRTVAQSAPLCNIRQTAGF